MAKKKLGTGIGELGLIAGKAATRKRKDEDGTEARSFRVRRSVLARLDIAAAITDEKIGEFVERAIAERIERLEAKRGSKFPSKDTDK